MSKTRPRNPATPRPPSTGPATDPQAGRGMFMDPAQVPSGLAKPATDAGQPLPSRPTPPPPPPASPDAAATATLAQAVAQGVSNALMPFLTQMLPHLLAQAVGQAVAQAMPREHCSDCLTARLQWETKHEAALEAAHRAACAQAGIAQNDPRAQTIDVSPFLPEELRPASESPDRMPPLNPFSSTRPDGVKVCPLHMLPQTGTEDRKPFLIAHAGFHPGMLNQSGPIGPVRPAGRPR